MELRQMPARPMGIVSQLRQNIPKAIRTFLLDALWMQIWCKHPPADCLFLPYQGISVFQLAGDDIIQMEAERKNWYHLSLYIQIQPAPLSRQAWCIALLHSPPKHTICSGDFLISHW